MGLFELYNMAEAHVDPKVQRTKRTEKCHESTLVLFFPQGKFPFLLSVSNQIR